MENITKQQAKDLGIKRFYTGYPCGFGHVAECLVSNGSCVVCHRLRSAKWRKKNPDKVVAQNNSYHRRNSGAINAKKYSQRAERFAADPVFAEKERIRGLIKASLSNRGYSKRTKTAVILGCTWEEFKSHIERQFLKGMNWENRELWHIDHITPMASAKTEDEAVALNNFTNLRPIWARDNLKKNGKALFLI